MSVSVKEKEHVIEFTVNGDPFNTTERVLTPVQIMQLAGVDPATNYLVQLHGHGDEQESYQNDPNKDIHMHPRMRFITLFSGPTPVS